MKAPRHCVAALAALATAVIAVLIPAAGTTAAPGPSLGVLRAKLADAIADEQRALALLEKQPPRTGAAKLALDRSSAQLKELLNLPLSNAARTRIRLAAAQDGLIAGNLAKGEIDEAKWRIGVALQQKDLGMEQLQEPRQGSQCADRKDNDGDGLVDARHDSGCANGKDATEQSPLTFRFEVTRDGLVATIEGATSGPISRIQITVPSGSPLDTKQPPQVGFSLGCRYLSARQLECLMKDGLANPRHVVKARFKLTRLSVSGLRVLIKDFAGRGRAQTVMPSQPTTPGGTVDPVTARCAARFDFSGSRLTVRCDGIDVKSSSVSTGGPVVSDVRPADAASAGLSRRCEPRPVSGSGLTAARCLWNAGNKGQTLSFQFAHDRALGAVTIHVLAGGSGEEGTTIVLRQTWRPLEGFLCQQSIPRADTCATP